MKRSMRLQRTIRIELLILTSLFGIMLLAGCGHEQQHGVLFPNGPTSDCASGPDDTTKNLPVGIVVSEHCKPF